ncbi:hypothetical protein E2C11_29015, partial [Streptomyces lavendulae]
MSIVAELVNGLGLRAGLVEKARRWEREDDERGPEPEGVVVTRTFLPVGPGWADREPAGLPSLPDGYIVAGPVVGSDEIRAQRLVVEAQAEFGWGR